jgi:hypothetical protein
MCNTDCDGGNCETACAPGATCAQDTGDNG